MSADAALLARAQPQVVAQRIREIWRNEILKGCRPELAPNPVPLEPPFLLLGATYEHESVSSRALTASNFQPPLATDLLRWQIWISPEQPFDWARSELFLKQLVGVSHRVGLEIAGNCDAIQMAFLCHRADSEILRAAFDGEFAHCALSEPTHRPLETISASAWRCVEFADYYPPPPYSHLLTRPPELRGSPFEPLLAGLGRLPPDAVGFYQCLFEPANPENAWHRNVEVLVDLEFRHKLSEGGAYAMRQAQQQPSGELHQMAGDVVVKAHDDKPFYFVAVRVGIASGEQQTPERLPALSTFIRLFQHGGHQLRQVGNANYQRVLSSDRMGDLFVRGLTHRHGFLLNSNELTGLVHIPPTVMIECRRLRIPMLKTLSAREDVAMDGTPIGVCDHAGTQRTIIIPPDVRIRHTHILGRSGMGKSSLLEQMILHDIEAGAGVAVLDPHGDLVERLLHLIGASHVERTIYFDPGDRDWIPLWNPLRRLTEQDPGRSADEMVGAIKSVVSGWGDRLENLLRNVFYGIIHLPDGTILDAANLMHNKCPESKKTRDAVLEAVENVTTRNFWINDYEGFRKDEVGPPKNKLSKLLISDSLSLMLSQPESAFDFHRMMESQQVLLANLHPLGPGQQEMLGALMLSLFHIAALRRSGLQADQRPPFHIYCDEAHLFVTDAFEKLIAETRKYGVSLNLSHQYLSQFSKDKQDALGGVGTTIVLNVNHNDANHLIKDFQELVKAKDLISLNAREAIARIHTEVTRLHIPDRREIPATTCRAQIISESRRRYYKPAAEIRAALQRRFGNHRDTKPEPIPACRADWKDEDFRYDEF